MVPLRMVIAIIQEPVTTLALAVEILSATTEECITRAGMVIRQLRQDPHLLIRSAFIEAPRTRFVDNLDINPAIAKASGRPKQHH